MDTREISACQPGGWLNLKVGGVAPSAFAQAGGPEKNPGNQKKHHARLHPLRPTISCSIPGFTRLLDPRPGRCGTAPLLWTPPEGRGLERKLSHELGQKGEVKTGSPERFIKAT